MSTLIKIYCPKCSGEIEGDELTFSQLVLCPHCGHEFEPSANGFMPTEKATPVIMPAPQRTAPMYVPQALTPEMQITRHRKKIRSRADNFTNIAIGFLILSGLALVAWAIAGYTSSQMTAPDQDDAAAMAGAEMVFGFCMKAAAGCYLIAQVIHIRANTEGKL